MIDLGSKKGSGGVSGGVPGLSWRVLGESRGPLGGVLGRPGAISVKTFWLLNFKTFFDPKREVPGRHFGGILGAKTGQKSIKNRDRNSRAKKEALERDSASIPELPKGKKY